MKKKRTIIDGYYKTKHPLYTTYKGMLARCNHPNSKYYKYYGGRGIKVAKRWQGPLGFKHFVEDMGERPKGFTIERLNNNRGYSAKNCTWVTMSTQALNRRLQSNSTSGYVGVNWYKACNMWNAYIDHEHKRKHLGYFHNLHDAIEARRLAEEERSKK